MPTHEATTLRSRVVPTEYDIEHGELRMGFRMPFSGRLTTIRVPGFRPVALTDDRGRRFTGLTVARAFARAERAQDPADPIHHPPYPGPKDVPLQ